MLKQWIRRTGVGVVSLGLMAAVGVAQDPPPNIKAREKEQQKRIREGRKTGELTKKETVKLEAKEEKLHEKIQKDRKDGGGLTAKERAKIQKRQNKISKDIYDEKHDAQQKKN